MILNLQFISIAEVQPTYLDKSRKINKKLNDFLLVMDFDLEMSVYLHKVGDENKLNRKFR